MASVAPTSALTLLLLGLAAAEFVCEKDTRENCMLFPCGSELNAQCVKSRGGDRQECYCKDGGCAVPKNDGSNDLHCVSTPKCAAYSACMALGLPGESDCCPTPGENGTMLDCCSRGDEDTGYSETPESVQTPDSDFVCQKDTRENCMIFDCGSDLNAECVRSRGGDRSECYCRDGGCAVSKNDGSNNLHCVSTSKCAAFSACVAAGLPGHHECCPTPGENGTMLDCCFAQMSGAGPTSVASLWLVVGASAGPLLAL